MLAVACRAPAPWVALAALFALTGCASPRPAAAQAPAARSVARAVASPAVADARASVLARAVAEQLLVTARLPGLSVAVSRGDTLLFAQGFGFADVEARRPVTPATRFRAASVSKMITATALLRLVQAGRLDLYLERAGVYALVRPDVAFHLTLEHAAGAVRGRAVRYWTLLRESPAGTAPFLTFEGRLSNGG